MPIFYFVTDQEADCMKRPLDAERLLRGLGVTRKLIGFRCAAYMIERIAKDPDQLQLITKRLYRETAKEFGISPASVERNLRTLIRACWDRADHSFLNHIAGAAMQAPPTNCEFLDMLAGHLRAVNGWREGEGHSR